MCEENACFRAPIVRQGKHRGEGMVQSRACGDGDRRTMPEKMRPHMRAESHGQLEFIGCDESDALAVIHAAGERSDAPGEGGIVFDHGTHGR